MIYAQSNALLRSMNVAIPTLLSSKHFKISSVYFKSACSVLARQEGILAYKVINGTYLHGDVLTDSHELDHYQLRNFENLRIPQQRHTVNYLFVIEL